MALTLTGVELRRLSLPLVAPFRSAAEEVVIRDVLLIRISTSVGPGWGECAAPAEPAYSSEYVDGAQHVLRHHLVPRLLEAAPFSAEDVAFLLAPVRGHRMAKAALEMAVIDAELRHRAVSLASYLGATSASVEAGVAVGITGSIDGLLAAVEGHAEEGYRRVKLKISPGWDTEPVAAVRNRFGADLSLLVDANGSYRLDDAEHLSLLDEFDLVLIEQPLAPDALLDHARLAQRIATPVCLDESVTSATVAADVIAMGAAAYINVKAPRVGGLLEARRVHDVCRAAGVPVWCGGMLETGVGRAANLALAALPNFTLPGDLSASDRYFATDLTPPFRLEDGRLRVPDGPGLGVDVVRDVLDRCTTAVEHVRS